MSNTPSSLGERPFVLVIGVDLADQASSGYAFDEAMRLASRIPDSEAHIVHVVSANTPQDRSEQAAGLLRLYVADKTASLDGKRSQRIGIHVRRGNAAEQIAQLGSDVGADMIVVGTHRVPHLKNLFVGSTAEQVMVAAACPVFVAGPKPRAVPAHSIVIEAACPDCIQRRFETRGAAWWCERHSQSHHLRRRHVYSYHTELPFAEHDSEVTATGSD